MIRTLSPTLLLTLLTATVGITTSLLLPVDARADTSPLGIWMDHTGRGAVEITSCGSALCGKIVGGDASSQEACGVQVIGAAKPTGPGVWDGGWIFDPEADAKYSLEVRQLDANRLKITGYEGIKMFGETFVWTRASAEIVRCKT
jgi:uncharacterized protein (DUF2147 family)